MTGHRTVLLPKRGLRFLATIAVLAMALVPAACGENLTPDEYVRRAESHRQAFGFRAAVIELKNALQKQPDHAAARLMLGQIYLEIGDAGGAEIELTRARDLGADAEAVALGLGELWLLQRKHDKVLAELPAGLPPKPARLILRGRAELGLNRVTEAEQAFQAAAAADPSAPRPLVWLGRLSMAQGKLAEAGSFVERALQVRADDTEALGLTAEIAFQKGDFAASEAAFREVLKKRREDLQAYSARLGIARATLASGKTKEAIELLDPIVKAAPNDPFPNYLRALAAYQAKDWQTAQTRAETVLKVSSDHRPSVLLAGGAAYALGQYERALGHLQRFVTDVPDNLDARKLLAATQLRIGRAKEAAGTLEKGLGKAGAEEADLLGMIGAATARAGDLKGASGYFQRAVAQKPDDAAARARLGVVRVALGQREEGVEDIEQAIELDPKLQRLEIGVALTHIRAREFDKALEVAQRLQESMPSEPVGFTLAGLAQAGKGDLEAAKAAFRKALEIKPGATDASANLAAIEVRQGNLAGAEQVLKESLARNAGNQSILMRLAQVSERQGKRADVKVWLEQAIAANPEAPVPRAFLARWYLAAGQPEQALLTTRPVEQAENRNPILLETIGQAQIALRQFENAAATYSTLVEVLPKSAQARVLLAEAYAAAGNGPKVRENIDAALAINPNYLPAELVNARYLLLMRDVDGARKQIGELAGRAPDDPRVKELQARLALNDNNPKRAAELLGEARKRMDNSGMVMAHALALWQAGERNVSVKTLEDWVASRPGDAATRLNLNRYYAALGRTDAIKTNLQQLLEHQPNNWIALNDLAWYQYREGKLDDAQKHAEKALQLAPSQPNVKDTLGMVLLARNDNQRALKLIREAAASAPDNPQIAFHLAQALAKTGDRAEAKSVVEKALSGNKAFEGREQAEKLLQELRQ